MSSYNKTVIAYCSIPGIDTDCYIKVFTYDAQNNKFTLNKNSFDSKSSNKNITLNP